MMVAMRKTLTVAILAALAATACGGITTPSSNKVDPISGTVQPNSFGLVHQFTISGNGEVLITVTAITPGNVFLGVLYGQLAGNTCSPIQQAAVSSASLGRTAITSQAIIKGEYCVQLYDAAAAQGLAPMAVSQNYTATVSHP